MLLPPKIRIENLSGIQRLLPLTFRFGGAGVLQQPLVSGGLSDSGVAHRLDRVADAQAASDVVKPFYDGSGKALNRALRDSAGDGFFH